MSNVIQLKAGSRRASTADVAQVVAIAKDRVELTAWREYAVKLRELEAWSKDIGMRWRAFRTLPIKVARSTVSMSLLKEYRRNSMFALFR